MSLYVSSYTLQDTQGHTHGGEKRENKENTPQGSSAQKNSRISVRPDMCPICFVVYLMCVLACALLCPKKKRKKRTEPKEQRRTMKCSRQARRRRPSAQGGGAESGCRCCGCGGGFVPPAPPASMPLYTCKHTHTHTHTVYMYKRYSSWYAVFARPLSRAVEGREEGDVRGGGIGEGGFDGPANMSRAPRKPAMCSANGAARQPMPMHSRHIRKLRWCGARTWCPRSARTPARACV
jgi:hypothetical protein